MNKCCICKEELQQSKEYWSIRHLENGKSHIFKGHKRCLFLLNDRIKNGENVEYEEIDTPNFNQ